MPTARIWIFALGYHIILSMRKQLVLLSLFLVSFKLSASTVHFHHLKNKESTPKEIRFIELKALKEINDKKNSPLKKYTLAILAARELKIQNSDSKSLEFYKIASEIKVDIDKTEVREALKKKNDIENFNHEFFYDANIKELITQHAYERAILAINPYQFVDKENSSLRIIYDLLNIRIKKSSVKKLYCDDRLNTELDGLNYQEVLCDFLNDFLKDGKKDKFHLAYIEDYFLKKDLNQRYLLKVIEEL